MKNNAEELVIKESLTHIKLKRGSRKKKSYVCKCNFDPLFTKHAHANTRYADLLRTEEFEVSSTIVMRLPLQFVEGLDKKISWAVLPPGFCNDMKTEVERYRNEELIALKLYSSPGSSPPIFQFYMKGGKDGNSITTHDGAYEHVKQRSLP